MNEIQGIVKDHTKCMAGGSRNGLFIPNITINIIHDLSKITSKSQLKHLIIFILDSQIYSHMFYISFISW